MPHDLSRGFRLRLAPAICCGLVLGACSLDFKSVAGLRRGLSDSGDTLEDSMEDSDTEDPVDTAGDEGPNLLVNGGFEGGEGSQAGVAPGWATTDGLEHAENYLDTRAPYAERQSQCIATGGVWDQGSILQLAAAGSVSAGRLYRLRVTVRSEGVTSASGWYLLGLRWYDGETLLGEEPMEPPSMLNYDWTEIVLQGIAPEGADGAAALLNAHTNGTACYDEAVLARVGA